MFKQLKQQTQRGFSLIELMVVITLLSLVSIMTTQIFYLNLRSHNKSRAIQEVKHSGDYAISMIEKVTRTAADIEQSSCNTNSQAFTLINPDGYTTRFECTSDNRVASVSGSPISLDTRTYYLTDTALQVSNCLFRVVCPQTSPKYVFVSFTLSKVGTNGSVDTRSTSNYQNTISLRNFQ